ERHDPLHVSHLALRAERVAQHDVDRSEAEPHGHRLVEGDPRRPLELDDGPVANAARLLLAVGRSERHRVRRYVGGPAERGRRLEPAVVAPKVCDDVEDLLGRALDVGLERHLDHRPLLPALDSPTGAYSQDRSAYASGRLVAIPGRRGSPLGVGPALTYTCRWR